MLCWNFGAGLPSRTELQGSFRILRRGRDMQSMASASLCATSPLRSCRLWTASLLGPSERLLLTEHSGSSSLWWAVLVFEMSCLFVGRACLHLWIHVWFGSLHNLMNFFFSLMNFFFFFWSYILFLYLFLYSVHVIYLISIVFVLCMCAHLLYISVYKFVQLLLKFTISCWTDVMGNFNGGKCLLLNEDDSWFLYMYVHGINLAIGLWFCNRCFCNHLMLQWHDMRLLWW